MSANDRNLVHYQRLPKEFLIAIPNMTGKVVEKQYGHVFIRSAFEGRRPPGFFDMTPGTVLSIDRNSEQE